MVTIPHPFRQIDDIAPAAKLRIAVVGAGYWGPNLVRNFQASPDWDLVAVCDLDLDRARKARRPRSGTSRSSRPSTSCWTAIDVDAVAIATPARTHHAIALAALRGRQARAGGEAAGRQPGEAACEMVAEAAGARAGPDVRPHLLLHAGGAEDPRS